MQPSDAATIISIAGLAAFADGTLDTAETAALVAVAERHGVTTLDAVLQQAKAGTPALEEFAAKLSGPDAREAAYDAAVALCHANGEATESEVAFLARLRTALDLPAASAQAAAETVAATAALAAPAVEVHTRTPPDDAELDQLILGQAQLTAACELLPDRLANLAILPLQLRLVYQIGQRHGQPMDANQVKDLAGALGIGAAAQVMETAVRKVLGGIGSTILGGLFGGATGVAAGAAVSFSATYALGHAAKQYYRQGRSLSTADLQALFTRFQAEAQTLFPKVQETVQQQAKGLDLQGLLAQLRR